MRVGIVSIFFRLGFELVDWFGNHDLTIIILVEVIWVS
jgi:hypothetical protein